MNQSGKYQVIFCKSWRFIFPQSFQFIWKEKITVPLGTPRSQHHLQTSLLLSQNWFRMCRWRSRLHPGWHPAFLSAPRWQRPWVRLHPLECRYFPSLELDRWGRDLLAVDCDRAGGGLTSGWSYKISCGDTGCGWYCYRLRWGTGKKQGGNKDHEKNDATDDEPGETGSPGHLLSCIIRLIIVIVTLNIVVATLKIRIIFPDSYIRLKQGFFLFPWTIGYLIGDLPSNRCY
jgi:hypothetical protein